MRHLRMLTVILVCLAINSTQLVAQKNVRFAVTGAGQGLTRLTSEKVDELGPAVSPDGTSLLFDTRWDKNEAVIVGLDPRSGSRRTIYTGSSSRAEQVAWDPQGRFFVFTSNAPGRWSLVRSITNSANAAISIIVSGEVAPIISHPSLSPDRKRVTFCTVVRGAWNIAVANLDGSNLTFYGEGRNPSWSSVNRIAFWKIAGNRAQIYTLNPETGGELTQITTGESDNIDPSWNPDGTYLVFSSNRTSGKAPRGVKKEIDAPDFRTSYYNLFAVRADGAGMIQLTDGKSSNIMPDWGHDGWVYFSSDQDGKSYDIWRLKPAITDAAKP